MGRAVIGWIVAEPRNQIFGDLDWLESLFIGSIFQPKFLIPYKYEKEILRPIMLECDLKVEFVQNFQSKRESNLSFVVFGAFLNN